MKWVVEHVHRDGSIVARVPMAGSELRIGRALDNDLVLDDPHCAAHHAVLRIDADGRAKLHDLNTLNGIRIGAGLGKSKRHTVYPVQGDAKIQLGASSIRVRHGDWELAPEMALSARLMWPLALLALMAVLAHAGWEIWLKDVHDGSLTYLSILSALAAGLAMWSAMYALLGRVLGGADRFFTHLLIVSCGYLGGTLVHNTLELLAFTSYWLWPLRIASYATVVVVALTVRAHLRVADPRHWAVSRWGVALVSAMAIAVPLGQTWISSKRLTHVQVVNVIEHPALRLARPVSIPGFMETTAQIKTRVDQQRAVDNQDVVEDLDED
jgi:hypothetical protein